MPDAVSKAVEAFAERGLEARVVKLDSSARVRAKSPTAYGVFGIVYEGEVFCYHYLGSKELRELDEMIGNPKQVG
jgi:hypothetical protein